MEKVKLLLLAATIVVSCQEKTEPSGEPCSIQLTQILFTKSLNYAAKNATVENDKISIKSDAKKDYFNDPSGKLSNNTAPVLLSKVDNTKPFTLTAKVTPSFNATYDAGTLYLLASEKLWQKFAFERDERGRTRIVSVRTMETSDDNNHDVVTQESVYLKISSDTKTVGLYYSIDNIGWNLARLYKNNYPEIIWVGVGSQSPTGQGNATYFENVSLTDKTIADFRMGI